MRKYRVISADGHLEAMTFSDPKYMPEKYKDIAPRLVKKDDGTDWWVMGEYESKNAGNLYSGARYNEWVKPMASSYHFADGTPRPGTGDNVSRLREQDVDGIDAEVLYAPAQGARFYRLFAKTNPGAHIALHQAYNTFVADYCSIAPDRLIGTATLPETGVDDAITEMKRVRKLGTRAISLAVWPNGSMYAKPEEDDRFWAAALDLDMKIAPHKHFGGTSIAGTAQGPDPTAASCLAGFTPVEGVPQCMAQLLVHGTFDRFPKLCIYFAETNPGYLGYLMNAIDENYLRYKWFFDIKLKKMPSQYYRDHSRYSFIHDRMTMKYRYDIGLDLLMWGSDTPHSISTYPNSREILSELFEDVPEAERHQVLVGNVCKFFDLDPDKELTPTP